MVGESGKRDEEIICVSGTLDAIAEYIKTEFSFNTTDSAKAATLLWLERECELAETARIPAINIGLKSLEEFGDKAQGMVANSRVYINVDKVKVEVFRALPLEILNDILGKSEIKTIAIKTLLRNIARVASHATLVKEGLACVCLRTWLYVKGREHISFQVDAAMPTREFSRDPDSPMTCEFTQDDGKQHIDAAKWECPFHKEGNYCTLTSDKVKDILAVLVEQGILERVGDNSYAFL